MPSGRPPPASRTTAESAQPAAAVHLWNAQTGYETDAAYDARLRERYFGVWQGMTLTEIAAAYPDDPDVAGLIASARASSPRFAQMWAAGAVGVHVADQKTVQHPVVGPVLLDCDVLSVPCADLRIVTYTAPAGSPDAEKLDFLRVVPAYERP